MDSKQLESGDNSDGVNPPRFDGTSTRNFANNTENEDKTDEIVCTPKIIEDNEGKLKERIEQCKNIIVSLKIELNEEKSKLENERIGDPLGKATKFSSADHRLCTNTLKGDLTLPYNLYSASIDSKLNCDENLIEYEKQLQKYQNTLNMAQKEKKNAIRKQMLAKAYRLKLLEIENQCNVELLRVKQSLQCLEPLKIIANKWKSSLDNNPDFNNFDLIPRYPELNSNSGTVIDSLKSLDTKISNVACDDCTPNLL